MNLFTLIFSLCALYSVSELVDTYVRCRHSLKLAQMQADERERERLDAAGADGS